jgi:hypothetical protein
MVQNIEVLLAIFILFYILVIIYDIVIQVKLNKQDELDTKKENKLLTMLKEKEKDANYDDKELLKLLHKLSYLRVFNNIIINKKAKITKSKYLNVYSHLATYYLKRESLEKAYFAYSLGLIGLSNDNIDEYLFTILEDKSIYCVENALETLYTFKDASKVVKAYNILNKHKVNYNAKLITDSLLNYKGSKEELCQALFANFTNYNDEYKLGFINYFRVCKFNIAKELVPYINKDTPKELTLSIIRYYSKITYPKVVPLLLKYLDTNYFNDFSYDVVIIQTLSNYKEDKVITSLTKKLADSNYYIRYNSALALNKLTDIKKIKTTDTYGQEILKYIAEESR